MKKETIELEPIQGHIVLYCKGQYDYGDSHHDFFEGLKKIWAIRCGYGYEQTGSDTLAYVAMDMYRILTKTHTSERMSYVMDQLHRNAVSPHWSSGGSDKFTPIEAIIWEYRTHISNMQVREKDETTDEYYWLVKLPEKNEEFFNRILSGNGKYNDYDLITK